jgi:hypothetical protein
MPVMFKEVWRADPSTWLDLETSTLSWIPIDIFKVHVLPFLPNLDLTWFLLSLGYGLYNPIAPLPQWLSDWLWDNREYTHTLAAHRFTGWEDTSTHDDWILVRNRLKFDGDIAPDVHKKQQMK